jgi:hypothetical protein
MRLNCSFQTDFRQLRRASRLCTYLLLLVQSAGRGSNFADQCVQSAAQTSGRHLALWLQLDVVTLQRLLDPDEGLEPLLPCWTMLRDRLEPVGEPCNIRMFVTIITFCNNVGPRIGLEPLWSGLPTVIPLGSASIS